MQLLLAVVQAEDADLLVQKLVTQGFRVTRINSVGSFLARGNATILIGVEEEQVEQVLAVMRATCHTRRAFVNALPQGADIPHMSLAVPMPLEIQVGGAIIWSFPVKRFLQLRGTDVVATEYSNPPTSSAGGDRMNLVLAVVQNEDADAVTQALLTSGYRLTRLNTAGGFFRRGNATLLIGVEQPQVDAVLELIRTNCCPRAESNASTSGVPVNKATVFVLEATNFLRM